MADESKKGDGFAAIGLAVVMIIVVWFVVSILYYASIGFSSQQASSGAPQQTFRGLANMGRGPQQTIINHPSTNPCPPGTSDQTDWSARPIDLPNGGKRYPHRCM